MEMIFLAVWKMRQTIEFQKTRVVVQAQLSQQGVEGKLIEKAFEDLRQAFFPFEKTQREETNDLLRKALHKEVSRGALTIKPQMDLTRAQMRQKLTKGAMVVSQRADLLRQGRLKPIDQESPFLTARRRSRSPAS
jgi:hypothetical protein